MKSKCLPLRFYRRPTLVVARDLLGRVLCRRWRGGRVLRGRITEVEAYDGFSDKASHASRGRTPRNGPMFEAGGIAYVYLIYGMHHCLNVVTGSADYPAAVLIRSTDSPREGYSATGPGRLTRAFEVDRSFDGISLLGERLWLERGTPAPSHEVRRTPRIGVDYAGAWAQRRYRFLLAPTAGSTRSRRRRSPSRDS